MSNCQAWLHWTVLLETQLIVCGMVSMIETVWLQKLLKPHGFDTSHSRVMSFVQMHW